MNIAFVEFTAAGTLRTRAEITPLDRAAFSVSLGADERLESFLYASPPGVPWPCGPTPDEWRALCAAMAEHPAIKPGIEAALAASRHRFLAMPEGT